MAESIKFLIPTFNWLASTTTGTSPASGFSLNDAVSGPRSRMVRHASSSGYVNVDLVHETEAQFQFCLLTRADKLLTANGMRTLFYRSDDAVSYTSLADYNPLGSSDLVGIDRFGMGYGQDLVHLESSVSRAHSMRCQTLPSSGSEARMFSTFSAGIVVEPDRGVITNPRPQWVQMPEDSYFQPQRATAPYEIEARISLSWLNLSDASIEALTEFTPFAYDLLLSWPIYLYDADATLWNHKLEHVLIEDIQLDRKADSLNDLQITFSRLRHYR